MTWEALSEANTQILMTIASAASDLCGIEMKSGHTVDVSLTLSASLKAESVSRSVYYIL